MGKEIGIDLGTTNTIVSYINKSNKVVPLKMNKRDYIIPSVLYFRSKNDYEIGATANKAGLARPSACIRNFKSKMGDPRYKFTVKAQNGEIIKLTALQASGKFLSKVIYNMQDIISEEFAGTNDNYIEKAVITVPEKFNAVEREATINAGLSANLSNISLMMEPTAGAVAYMEENNIENKTVLVYDFGGGTFDISLLENRNGIFRVIRTDGDKNLGGNTLTSKIIKSMIDVINEDYGWDMPYNIEDFDPEYCMIGKDAYIANYSEIYTKCEAIKMGLSEGDDEFQDEIPLVKNAGSTDYEFFEYCYSADEINKLIEKDIQSTIDLTKSMIDWANEHDVHIDDIVLIGGSSQIPMIEEKLSKIFPSVIVDIDVSALISKGAARVANNSRIEIMECTNAEIGVKSQVGALLDAFKMIIPDNAPLPYTNSADFIIKDDSSGSMKIAVYERDIKRKIKNETIRDKSVRKIDEIIIDNLPENSSGRPMTATITFTYNNDGSLSLNADIKQDGVVVVSNHKVRKESNLIQEEGD